MSNLRIAFVAEGKTDQIVIEAALRAILGRPFVLTLLQPETSDPFGASGPFGGGWGGVYRWCRQVVSVEFPVGHNPSLVGFDLVMLHVDADVAGMRYEDANIDDGRSDLPCERPCPPAADTVNVLRDVIAGWLNLSAGGSLLGQWVFCNPSRCTETWIVAGLYRSSAEALLSDIECNRNMQNWLSARPAREGRLIKGGRKQVSAYKGIARQFTRYWNNVHASCSQAARFETEVRKALGIP